MGLGVWVQNQHQGEDRCFQQNKITKAAAFLCFLSHRSQGRKVLLFSTLLLCPPDPSLHPRALGNKPPLPPDEEQGAGSGSSPAGRALPHLSTPCRLQPPLGILSAFPSVSPATSPLSCCFPACSRFSAFLLPPQHCWMAGLLPVALLGPPGPASAEKGGCPPSPLSCHHHQQMQLPGLGL